VRHDDPLPTPSPVESSDSLSQVRLRSWLWPSALAALIALTSLVVASVSVWLVLPYLFLMFGLLFAPDLGRLRIQALPAPGETAAEPSSSQGAAPELDSAGPPASSDAVALAVESGTAKAESAPAKLKRGKSRGRGKAKPAPEPPSAPVTVSWVRVGPGKFVRVEGTEADLGAALAAEPVETTPQEEGIAPSTAPEPAPVSAPEEGSAEAPIVPIEGRIATESAVPVATAAAGPDEREEPPIAPIESRDDVETEVPETSAAAEPGPDIGAGEPVQAIAPTPERSEPGREPEAEEGLLAEEGQPTARDVEQAPIVSVPAEATLRTPLAGASGRKRLAVPFVSRSVPRRRLSRPHRAIRTSVASPRARERGSSGLRPRASRTALPRAPPARVRLTRSFWSAPPMVRSRGQAPQGSLAENPDPREHHPSGAFSPRVSIQRSTF
jgi:hypothetical protein